tara:strand:- start:23988 stop:24170 length:183 start_codon:yes stop_codon:yes gene_type:complete
MTIVEKIQAAAPLNADKVAALAKEPDFIENGVSVLKIMWTAKMLNLTYVRKRKPLTVHSF